MQIPSAALAWELWRRNRLRLIGMLAMLLGFAFIYPRLCAQAGVDLSNSDDMVSFTGKFMKSDHTSRFIVMIQVLYLLFLAARACARHVSIASMFDMDVYFCGIPSGRQKPCQISRPPVHTPPFHFLSIHAAFWGWGGRVSCGFRMLALSGADAACFAVR